MAGFDSSMITAVALLVSAIGSAISAILAVVNKYKLEQVHEGVNGQTQEIARLASEAGTLAGREQAKSEAKERREEREDDERRKRLGPKS